MLQRDLPAPTRAVRDRARVGQGGFRRSGLDGVGAIGRQPVRPIFEAGFKRILDQQRPEAGAIDEEVAVDPCAGCKHQARDRAAFAVAVDLRDPPFDPADPGRFGDRPQEARIPRRIEVIGVGERLVAIEREAVRGGGLQFERIVPVFATKAARAGFEPEMLEVRDEGRSTNRSERVEIARIDPVPAFERDAELERRVGRADERILVHADELMEGADRRDRRFPDADRADVVGFDQRHIDQPGQLPHQSSRGKPSGGATAGNNDTLADRGAGGVGHRLSLFATIARSRRAVIASSGASGPCAAGGRCAVAVSVGPKR